MNRIWKLAIPMVLVGLLIGGGAAFAQDTVTIAYVDLQAALNTVEDGQSARSELESDFERRQAEIDAATEEFEAWVQEMQAGLTLANDEVRMQRMQEYEERMMALQQMFQQHQVELAQAEAEATGEIFEHMVEIIAEVAAERGYTYVLERTESSILYAADGLDFTEELVRRYDERY